MSRSDGEFRIARRVPRSAELEGLATEGTGAIDLCVSNPGLVGLGPAWEPVARALTTPAAALYEPSPQGLRAAREAVCQYYLEAHGVSVGVEQVFLTASTSESYAMLLQLLADPGEVIRTLEPTYPLLEVLGSLQGAALAPWRAHFEGRWELHAEPDAPRPAGVFMVHPNNPTGQYLTHTELHTLDEFCASRGCALVMDEVFVDYGVEAAAETALSGLRHPGDALRFTLSGLSKVCALPQVKLGWIVLTGPENLRRLVTPALELIADSYLSVSGPVQHAAGTLLALRPELQGRIRARLRENVRAARELLRAWTGSPCTALPVEGGWSMVVRVPETQGERAWVEGLAREAGVRVNPGFFYDFPRGAWLVVSLLPEPAVFREGFSRVLTYLRASLGG